MMDVEGVDILESQASQVEGQNLTQTSNFRGSTTTFYPASAPTPSQSSFKIRKSHRAKKVAPKK